MPTGEWEALGATFSGDRGTWTPAEAAEVNDLSRDDYPLAPMAATGQPRTLSVGELGSFREPPMTSDEPDGAGMADHLRALLRFKWTVLGTWVLVTAAATAVIWGVLVPKYKAVAQVQVRPIIPHLVFPKENAGQIPLYHSYLTTQVSVISGPTVLQRVLDQPEVQKTEFYKVASANPDGPPGAILELLASQLEVKPKAGTWVIDISLTRPDPHEAAVLVNAVLDEYLRYVQEATERTDDFVYRKLIEEERTLRNELEGREKIVDRLREELGTSDPNQFITLKMARIDQLEADKRALQKELSLAEMRKQRLQALVKGTTQPSGAATQPSSEQLYHLDPEWRNSAGEVKALRDEILAASTRYGDQHPTILELKARLKAAEDFLRRRQEQLDRDGLSQTLQPRDGAPGASLSPAAELHQLQGRVDQLKHEERFLDGELSKLRGLLKEFYEEARTLAREDEGIRNTRELYRAVRARLDQERIERNLPGSIEVLTRAYTPASPDNDKRMKLTIAAFLGALGMGVGFGLLRARTTQAFHEARELPLATGAPFLGKLPFVQDVESLFSGTSQALVESVRLLRTVLLHRLPREKGNVIVITGAGPGCGKSTVSALLANSLSRCSKKVLLVDTDIRKPTLSEHFGMKSQPGLIDLLTSDSLDVEAVVQSKAPGLSVLPAGKLADNADPELLADGALQSCLERWREQYEVILMDTAPVLALADPSILSREADGTIMVVRERHCRRAEVLHAYQELLSAGASLMGTVFIGSDQGSHYGPGYAGYYYSHSATTD